MPGNGSADQTLLEEATMPTMATKGFSLSLNMSFSLRLKRHRQVPMLEEGEPHLQHSWNTGGYSERMPTLKPLSFSTKCTIEKKVLWSTKGAAAWRCWDLGSWLWNADHLLTLQTPRREVSAQENSGCFSPLNLTKTVVVSP